MFSICVCSWNDLEYLKILHRSIKRNTKLPCEFLVHDNGSVDGTEEWLKANNIDYTRGETNEGVAAVNYSVERASNDYIVDCNADMYLLPGWDVEIFKQIQKFKQAKIEKFTISSCLIEPIGSNPEYTIRNHGHNAETFNEESLLQDYFVNGIQYAKINTTQYSHPITMPKALWEEFGGVDFRYPYGVATDHDIPASAYRAGCRDFIMLGKSRVYHFVNQTIKKLPPRSSNHEVFTDKWGMTVEALREKMKIARPYETVEEGIL